MVLPVPGTRLTQQGSLMHLSIPFSFSKRLALSAVTRAGHSSLRV